MNVQTSDNLTLVCKKWMPETPPKAILLLIHGFGEHIERYQHVGAFLNQNNIGLVGYDRRGHGKSEGQRGHFPNLATELDDMARVLQQLKNDYPNTPIVLYGHSQGGNFALNFLLRKSPDVAATIITSPWLSLTQEPPKALVAIGKILHKFLPTLSTKAAVNTLSRDPEVNKRYQEDPLVHGTISFRAANETMDAGNWLLQYQKAIATPLLLMHGTGDLVTASSSSQAFYQNTQESIDVKWWEGFYHELHNEPEKEEVLAYMLEWVKRHI